MTAGREEAEERKMEKQTAFLKIKLNKRMKLTV